MAAVEGTSDRCSWCGAPVAPGDGYRAAEHPGARRAVFCRLEHVVPWVLQGARWSAGGEAGGQRPADGCARCGTPLGDVHIVLTRHRGEHRIDDFFCSAGHMADWAKAGGRWR